MSLEVRSYGAAETVTGSCHLIDDGQVRVLVDCGAFQGSRALFALNREPFGFEPASVDAVLLSHAHLDHIGRLPVLVRDGFSGPIYARPATKMLAEQLLMDAAKIQTEDAERAKRRGRQPDTPLFVAEDVRPVLEQMRTFDYGAPFDAAGMRVAAQVAGHVPGSASFIVDADGQRMVFSGDLGNERKDVLPDPTPCPEADTVFVESTYGDRDHRDFAATLDEFAGILREATRRRGTILIPSFALERTQDVLFHIARLEDEGQIEPIPVWVDSPLADRIEDVYQACLDEMSDDVRAIAATGRDPFAPQKLRYTQTVDESKALDNQSQACIVIAGSGMMTGGRILHHLQALLEKRHTTVVVVGYQPVGGLGRQLVDGAQRVRVMGTEVAVNARIATIGGLSAHADRTELIAWSSGAGGGANFRLVHGERHSLGALRDQLRERGNSAEVQPSQVELPASHRDRGETE